MIAVRATLFVVSFLGVLYALLSVMSGADVDTVVGMGVALVGLAGWAVLYMVEDRR